MSPDTESQQVWHGYACGPIAAERVEGPDCEYDDCENAAEWLVEVENGLGFVCCQPCSNKNRIHARENEVYLNDVSDDVRDSVLTK